jgi:hypothetical protein
MSSQPNLVIRSVAKKVAATAFLKGVRHAVEVEQVNLSIL